MIVANACLILHIFQMGGRVTREEVLMDVMIHQRAEREAEWMQAHREELVERIARAIREEGTVHPLPGLHLYRHSFPLEQVYSVVEPSLCVVAQGSKEFMLDKSHFLCTSDQWCGLDREIVGVRVEWFEKAAPALCAQHS